MTKSVALLVLLLSNNGYWVSGQRTQIDAQRIADVKIPAGARLNWALLYKSQKISNGQTTFEDKGKFKPIELVVPEVRVAIEMRLVYQLTTSENGDEATLLDKGESLVHVYPSGLLQPIKTLVGKQELVVWDDKEQLPAALTDAGVPHHSINSEAGLAFLQPAMLIIGTNQLGQDLRDQRRLLALAKSGTRICIFRQERAQSIAGYPIIKRLHPRHKAQADANEKASGGQSDAQTKIDADLAPVFSWHQEHTLAQRRGLLTNLTDGKRLGALRLPADEPAVAIAYWASEEESPSEAPIDTMLAVKTVGKGRIVFCQLPLGDWESDPRSQLILRDIMDYLNSPIEPTLRPSQRKRQIKRTQPPKRSNVPESPSLLDIFEGQKTP